MVVEKWKQAVPAYVLTKLDSEQTRFLEILEKQCRFSFQQLRQMAEWFVDTKMWGMPQFHQLVSGEISGLDPQDKNPGQTGEKVFGKIRQEYNLLASQPSEYSPEGTKESLKIKKYSEKEIQGKVFRLCPAASDKAVCCGLKVINAVDNCSMACSYCYLQNHYPEETVKLPSNLKEKLDQIKLDPAKRYRIGTGEYSDSLVWGNRNNLLKDLISFAEKHPNAILELKTKSVNINWLLNNDIPENICCSWSLNPQVVIDNEEHRTPGLKSRLEAARTVCDKGIKVGFHFHPMMYYNGWREGYAGIAQKLMEMFSPEEVLWISYGSVSLMPGITRKVRENYQNSKLLQMKTEVTPDGKTTYAFEIRRQLYSNVIEVLNPWKDQVFQYLCMEHRPMWEDVMGFAYESMPQFDDAFNQSAFAKLDYASRPSGSISSSHAKMPPVTL